jgi:hypothetical protein
MRKILTLIFLLATLYGCMPGYTWVNTDYTAEEMSDHFVMDKGECIREADRTYPDPYPVPDPDELYYECMAYTRRTEIYPVKTEDGDIEYRTIIRRGNPWLCRPSTEHRFAYREYQFELSQQQISRAEYVNSCLLMMGWDRIKTE